MQIAQEEAWYREKEGTKAEECTTKIAKHCKFGGGTIKSKLFSSLFILRSDGKKYSLNCSARKILLVVYYNKRAQQEAARSRSRLRIPVKRPWYEICIQHSSLRFRIKFNCSWVAQLKTNCNFISTFLQAFLHKRSHSIFFVHRPRRKKFLSLFPCPLSLYYYSYFFVTMANKRVW